MNTLKCGDCVHYHEQERGGPKGLRPIASYALCAARSTYRADAPNLPDGAKTTSDAITKPVVITAATIVSNCEHARRP